MLRKLRLVLLFVASFYLTGSVFAHQESESPVRFIENKGQWEPHILYSAELPSGQVFLEADRLTFNFCDYSQLHDRWFHRGENESKDFPIDCHAFVLSFPGSQLQPQLYPSHPEKYYHNYFVGNDPQQWASMVKVYEEVRYENIYPGVDFVIYGQDHGLKYDFVVQPGADASQIKMHMEGLESMFLQNGELHLNTSVNKIIDAAPVSFQGLQEVPTQYTLSDDVVSFAFPEGYQQNSELRIDPTLVFSTFTGSFANNFGFSATYDDTGSLLAGGISYGGNYPVTPGAYQITFQGNFDVSISKFDPTGGHLWSTFVGGSSEDQPHSMVTNAAGDLFFMGRSNSSDYPATQGAHDGSANGGYDIIVSRISANGANLMASTYVGGSLDDGLNITASYVQQSIKYNYGDDARGEIVLDDNDNVYVAACTRSGNFPITFGALDNSLNGTQDGCAFKLTPTLNTLLWSTFIGGDGDDAAYSIKVDDNDRPYVTGGTSSSNFPTTSGSLLPTYQGSIDGFIMHLEADGSNQISATYIGTSGYNQCYFLELDRDGDVYVVGQKTGAWNITPAGIWSTPAGGQFIMKLNPDLDQVIYSTHFGTSNSQVNISPTAFLVDVCEFVYVSGWGGGTNFGGFTSGLPLSNNAFQSTTDGSDLYMLVLQADMAGIEYGTYIGGTASNEHVDGGTSRFNKRAEVYQSVCAGCQGNSDFPTTAGAFSSTNNSGLCNLACFKLSLDLEGIVADFYPDPDTAGCAPQTILFDNLSNGGNQYFWSFGDGGTSSAFSPTHTYPNPGVYEVQLIAIDSNTCNVVDTAYRTIVVNAIPVASVTPDTSICEGESVVLTAAGGSSYQWQPPIYLNNPVAGTVVATPAADVTYDVIVTNQGGCSDTTQVTVNLLTRPSAQAVGDTLICPGDTANLSASGGVDYQWLPSNGLSQPTAAQTGASPGGSTVYTVEVTAANGCTDLDTVTVDVSPIDAEAGPDSDLCIGDSLTLNGSGGSSFQWTGSGLSNPSIPNPTVAPSSDVVYTLTVTDQYGCVDEDSVRITVRPLPLVEAGSDVILCDNDSIQLVASGAQNYSWFPPTNLSNPNIGSPFAFPSSNTTYTVTGTDQFGCVNSDSLFIEVLPAPVAVATGSGTICQDSSIQLFASGGLSYSWSPSAGLSDPNIQDPLATLGSTTLFTVQVFAANGCDDEDTVLVEVTPTPVIDITGRPLICAGTFTSLAASGAETYEWNTGDNTSLIRVEPDSSTVYSVVGYVEGCPSLPTDFSLTVDQGVPTADFIADPDSGWVPMTTTFNNLSSGASTYTWDFGDGNGSTLMSPTHVYQDTGRFVVELIAYNENSCPDTIQRRVIVGADFSIFIPNAFTPNGDGVNDFFSTPWYGVREFHIMLFDRWGMLIYESFDPDFQWAGLYKGNEVQEGVYTYVIEARGYIGEKVRRAGTVTLYR